VQKIVQTTGQKIVQLNMPPAPADPKVNTIDYSFGNWVKRRRKALDLTQGQLAQQVGCSISLIFKIESDNRRPSHQIAELLAKQLEIPLDQRDLFLKVARQEKNVDHLERLPALSEPMPARVSYPIGINLPLPLTSIVGREHELRAIIQQIHDPACRLLTLTGPGGVGKTRLALEVAHQLRNSFKYGACFVSLVGTGASEFIVPAIADALGFVFSGATELKVQLFNYLKERQILLVLDNLEHLLNGIELLDELLEHTTSVKLLTTSREQLNLRTEWVFEVQGLPVPSHIELDHLASNSAATLFIQRAKQANANFSPSRENLSAITRICQLVEGLPLGLELAATWVRMMSLNEVAREIERNTDFLTTTERDVPQRHRSIRAVFDYSWGLLSDDERQVLRRLSVFRGGFTREAAEQVANAALLVLSALVDKSLVRRNDEHTGRYDLHELLRQYAALQLQAGPEEERTVRAQHASYYLSFLESRKPNLQSRRQRDVLAELSPETDNLRSAWDEAVSNRHLELIRRAAWSLWYIYELRTYFREGEDLIKRGVDMSRAWLAEFESNSSMAERTSVQRALGLLLAHQAFFYFRLGRNREAQELFQQSIALLRPLNEPSMLAFALAHYGILRSLQGEYADAILKIREGLELSNAVDDRWQIALSTIFLGMVLDDQGNYTEAYRLFSEALQLCRSLGDPRLISLAAGYLGQTAHTLNRLTEVPALLREELQAAAETNDRFGIALAGVRMAVAAQTRGNKVEARRLLQESIEHFREADDTWFLSHALNLEGKFALASGERAQADKSFRQAGDVAWTIQAIPMLLDALVGLAILESQQGHHERALQWVVHSLQHTASTQDTKNRAEKLRAELEAQLSSQKIEAVKLHAQSLTLEDVVQELWMK
jgi:predicted ATPase/transcriptional regulator with XRE-family HTH domain